MRKLMNKKGFTLVELMIVVVILGILVAVAVPIFNSVTKNARKKSCASNIRIIKGNLEQYQATGNNGDEVTFTKNTNLATETPDALMRLFDGGKFPVCPTKNSDGSDAAYTIDVKLTAQDEKNNVITYEVKCTSPEKNDHNPAAATTTA